MQEPPFGPPDPKATYPPGDDTTPGWGQSWGWNWTPDSAASSAPPTWVGLPPTGPAVPPAPSPLPARATRRGGRGWPLALAFGYVALRLIGAADFGHSTSDSQPVFPMRPPRITMNAPALAALPDSIGRYRRLGTAQADEFRNLVISQARTGGRDADGAIYVNPDDGVGFILTVWSGASAGSVKDYLRKVAATLPTLRLGQMQTATRPDATYACAPVTGHEPGSACAWASATEIGYLRAFTTTGDPLARIQGLHDAYVGGAAASPG